MQDLATVAPAFIEMAHQIVWCSVATVDSKGRPRTRILHPIWQWDGAQLIGWVATRPTGVKRAHLAGSAYLSASYWMPTHDTCVADCRAIWANDDLTRRYGTCFSTAPRRSAMIRGLCRAGIALPQRHSACCAWSR